MFCSSGSGSSSGSSTALRDTSPQTDRAEVREHLHAAAGGDLTPVSEPSDLRPGEAVDLRRLDERALTLGHSLRPLALYETAHIWQKESKSYKKEKIKHQYLKGKCQPCAPAEGIKKKSCHYCRVKHLCQTLSLFSL